MISRTTIITTATLGTMERDDATFEAAERALIFRQRQRRRQPTLCLCCCCCGGSAARPGLLLPAADAGEERPVPILLWITLDIEEAAGAACGELFTLINRERFLDSLELFFLGLFNTWKKRSYELLYYSNLPLLHLHSCLLPVTLQPHDKRRIYKPRIYKYTAHNEKAPQAYSLYLSLSLRPFSAHTIHVLAASTTTARR